MAGFQPVGSLPFLYSDFSGGLNTLNAPYLLNDGSAAGGGQARDLANVQGTTAGAIVKRGGLVTLATPPVTLTSLFPFETVNPILLVAAGGTSLYSISTGGTVTSIASGLTSGKSWEFVSAPVVAGQGPLYGMNGTDTPQQWSGTGSTANWTNASGGTAVPNGKYCVYFQNQVYVSGVAGFPSRVFWSSIADPTNWDPASNLGAGFEDFDPNDGEAISAIGTVGPYLLVAKPRKLWVLLSAATGASRLVSANVGVASHRSLAVGAEGTYFLAEDRGVYVFNGTKLTPISDVIQPTLDAIQPGLRKQAAGAYSNAHYYLSIPTGSSSNDTTLDFDVRLGSWWKHTFGSNQFALWHPAGPTELFSAKSTAGFVDKCFVDTAYQDNGSNFTWVWRGPWQSPSFYRRRRFPTPYYRKRLRQLRYDGGGMVDFSLAKDFAGGETLIQQDIFDYTDQLNQAGATFGGAGAFGTGTFGGLPQYSRGRKHNLGVANSFSMVFSGTNNYPASLISYVLILTDRRDLIVA